MIREAGLAARKGGNMGAVQWQNVQERLEWEVTTETYDQIRTVWLKHCDTELRQDMDGLLSTLTEDCLYTVVFANQPAAGSQQWKGLQGARAFYTALFQAFPEQNWQPEAVVIGPQGVFSAVVLNSMQVAPWAGLQPTGKPVSIRMFVYFLWDPQHGKFSGEVVYVAPMA
jgi:predicted ester cyclase